MKSCLGLRRGFFPTAAGSLLAFCLAAGCGPSASGGDNNNTNAVCGDDVAEGSEMCDGVDLKNQTCASLGFREGTLSCSADCTSFDTLECIPMDCGNGQIDTGELCDGSNLNGQTCQGLSYQEGTLLCGSNCTYDISDCHTCGNETREGPEECDGQQFGGTTCTDLGHSGGMLSCTAQCMIDDSSCYTCGDGLCETEKGESAQTCVEDCGWTLLSAGNYHTCGLTGNGEVFCWGANGSGQLGDGTNTSSSVPVKVQGLTDVVGLTAGGFHTCAVSGTGQAFCWGSNDRGQLGNGSTAASAIPVTVTNGSSVTSISAGGEHTCAVISQAAYCWGYNGSGQLGLGDTADRSSMEQLSSPTGVTIVDAGAAHTCAVTGSKTVFCWGRNMQGQVGDGTSGNIRTAAVQVNGLSDAVLVRAGRSDHTCAATETGAVMCWGTNTRGQMGTGSTSNDPTLSPIQSSIPSSVTLIDSGYDFNCAASDNQQVLCWGSNEYGKLADGTTIDRPTPQVVAGLATGASWVATGSQHACVVDSSGAAFCWGLNDSGQLGDGTFVDKGNPVQVVSE